jgi:hypothetical protein
VRLLIRSPYFCCTTDSVYRCTLLLLDFILSNIQSDEAPIMGVTLTFPCVLGTDCLDWISTFVHDQFPNVKAAAPQVVMWIGLLLASCYLIKIGWSWIKTIYDKVESIVKFLGCCWFLWHLYNQGHLARMMNEVQPVWQRFFVSTNETRVG